MTVMKWWLCIVLVCCLSVTVSEATVNLTSSVDGRRACPAEVVTYTCTGTGIGVLAWTAEPFIQDDGSNTFTFTTLDAGRVGQSVIQNCTNRPMQDCAGFQATLTSIDVLMVGVANMVSTLTVTATAMLNETVVQCSGTTVAGTLSATSALSVTSLPSPALFQTPSYTVQEYDRDNVTIRVLWEPPQDDGGAPAVNYAITISPGLDPLTTTATSAVVTIPYNVMHTVSIVVTNCNGSSTAMETIPAIVGCGAPSRPVNGSVQSLDPSQGTQEGSKIFFGCDTSYVPAGNMSSMCTSDGMWNPDPATFVCIFDCGPPLAPRNGSLENYTNTTEGSVVSYSCDSGFVPEMKIMANCTVNGWSPNPGASTCSVVNCGMPTAPLNGSIVSFTGTLFGAETFFMCNERFVPAGRMRASCTSDGMTVNGTWTPDPATLMCSASVLDCGDPNTATSGLMVQPYTSTAVNSVIFYQCQRSGFAPSISCSVCGEDEMWSPDPSQVVCRMVTTTIRGTVPATTPVTPMPTSIPTTTGLGAGGTAAIVVVILLLIAVLVVAMVIVGVIWWRRRSGPAPKPKPPPQMDDVAMYSVVDDHPEKPAPYKGYMLKGPEAEYTTIDDAISPSTSKAAEAQYDLPPGSDHPEGLVYAEVNIKGKPTTKPRPPKPAKNEDMVEYAAIAYQPKDAAEKSPPVADSKPKRMMLPDNPDDSVNLDNLLIQLKQVNAKWREIGDALGLPPSILDDISGQYQSDPQQCMVEMLDSWLMRHMHQGSPTWWEVALALRETNHDEMADALETVYTTGVLPITVNMDEIPVGSLPEDTSSPPPIPVRGPLTDEPDYPPPKPPRSTPEKKAAPPRPHKPRPEPSVPPRPPRAH